MALPAGRRGVLPSELTPEGRIKALPEHTASDAGKFLGVDSEGNLVFTEAGGKVYLHMIHRGAASFPNYTELLTIYSSNPEPIDNGEKLLAYMKARNINSMQRMIPCIGKYNSSSQTRNIGVYARMSSEGDRRVIYVTDNFTSGDASDLDASTAFTDNVIEL